MESRRAQVPPGTLWKSTNERYVGPFTRPHRELHKKTGTLFKKTWLDI
jgi:hypothetical protein